MKKLFIYLFVCSLGLTISCSDYVEEIENPDLSGTATEGVVTVIDGMLRFSDTETFDRVLRQKQAIPETFTSQVDIFAQVVEAEYDYACSLTDLSDEEYEKVSRHSDLYLSLLNESFLKEQKYTDGSKMYDLNLLYQDHSIILNKNGFYAIKDTIFQLTPTQLKVWPQCSSLQETQKVEPIIKLGSGNNASTKALFPYKGIDQAVAYATTNCAIPNSRIVVSFYDKTTLAYPNLNRSVHIRISCQKKVDGRNYVYVNYSYRLTGWISLNTNGLSSDMDIAANGTSGNAWYSPLLQFNFLTSGKVSQVYTDNYPYITDFFLNVTYTSNIINPYSSPLQNYSDYAILEGDRESPLAGPFYYNTSWSLNGTYHAVELLDFNDN